MIFESKLTLTAKDIEQIIIEHLKSKDTKGMRFHSVRFDVDSGYSGYPGDEYRAPKLNKATVTVDLEVA